MSKEQFVLSDWVDDLSDCLKERLRAGTGGLRAGALPGQTWAGFTASRSHAAQSSWVISG